MLPECKFIIICLILSAFQEIRIQAGSIDTFVDLVSIGCLTKHLGNVDPFKGILKGYPYSGDAYAQEEPYAEREEFVQEHEGHVTKNLQQPLTGKQLKAIQAHQLRAIQNEQLRVLYTPQHISGFQSQQYQTGFQDHNQFEEGIDEQHDLVRGLGGHEQSSNDIEDDDFDMHGARGHEFLPIIVN